MRKRSPVFHSTVDYDLIKEISETQLDLSVLGRQLKTRTENCFLKDHECATVRGIGRGHYHHHLNHQPVPSAMKLRLEG
jgi:hypothetical protein